MDRRPVSQCAGLILLMVAAFVHDTQLMIAPATGHQDRAIWLLLNHDSLGYRHLEDGGARTALHVLRVVLVRYRHGPRVDCLTPAALDSVRLLGWLLLRRLYFCLLLGHILLFLL